MIMCKIDSGKLLNYTKNQLCDDLEGWDEERRETQEGRGIYI